ncbi:lycopene beta-cyclase CrtY [uncultured Thiohalocapsa sp.]|uniref:lycopene beta-cyclase CrtY n=1 Tax=uncultured Thiohalocapsa sp. TaxID=768990 RepID=UPI0025E8BD0B|nr:lycopene beta-cyclase CrtY [uncultured Thiohalocapsa sp.]
MADATPDAFDADYLLVGGGLQNGLILLALAARKPQARVLLLEQGEVIGGNHIWSFQALDLPDTALDWARPIIEYEWPGYQLYFDDSARWVQGVYRSLSSEHLHRLVLDAAAGSEGIEVRLGAAVADVDGHSVQLADGTRLHGRVVVDARGPEAAHPMGRGRFSGGYQKFVGLECRLAALTDLAAPILMDSRCAQRDGFRFHYVLPFAPDRVLIEDTYFSNTPDLDVDALSREIVAEAPRLGLQVAEVLRTEVGVLPMPAWSHFRAADASPITGGYAGGWFNPGTGYSLAAAARLAEHLSAVPVADTFGHEWQRLTRRMRIQAHFLAFLNLLMFGFFHGAKRRRLMERFYMVSDAVIHRFFAMRNNPIDMWRIMYVGAPWTPKGWAKRPEQPAAAQVAASSAE